MFELDGFEWDSNKAEINIRKHGVTFEDFALFMPDPDHSFDEERFLLLGLSEKNRTLVVVHCERDQNIRLISARRATLRETKQYQEQIR